MRGDAALTARLLLRGAGLAGVTATVGGALGAIAATRPWYVAVADLTMLGDEQGRVVASLSGVPTTVLGWVAVALGLVAAVLGTGVAVDRPRPRARTALLVVAASLAVVTGLVAIVRPELARVAGSDGEELLELADRLPVGVELAISVRSGSGPALLALAAILVAVGAYAARERA